MFHFRIHWIKNILPLSPNHREKRWRASTEQTPADDGNEEQDHETTTQETNTTTNCKRERCTGEPRDQKEEEIERGRVQPPKEEELERERVQPPIEEEIERGRIS